MDSGRNIYYSDVHTPILSDVIDRFLVRPIKAIKMFHDMDGGTSLVITIVGYEEVRTGKKIIKRSFPRDEFGTTEVVQHDAIAGVEPISGDVFWNVDESNTASELLGVEEVDKYLQQSKYEMCNRINHVYISAQEMGEEYRAHKVRVKVKKR